MTIQIMLKKERTEGFDKAEELERLREEALQQVGQNFEQKRKPLSLAEE